MPLWQVGDERPSRIQETRLASESKLEQYLEDWIAADLSILGEPLYVIGRKSRQKTSEVVWACSLLIPKKKAVIEGIR